MIKKFNKISKKIERCISTFTKMRDSLIRANQELVDYDEELNRTISDYQALSRMTIGKIKLNNKRIENINVLIGE